MISPVDRSKKQEKDSGGSLQDGLSSQSSIDKSYVPRDSGEGQRPKSPTGSKSGKFKIK